MASCSKPVRTLAMFVLPLAGLQVLSASAQDVKQEVATCMVCHPRSEVPTNSPIPIIWGQNEGYVYMQLRDFKGATRAAVGDVVMHALTQTMTDAQMLEIAKYVSAQPWPRFQDKTTLRTDPLRARGSELTAYGDCSACHFNNWQGYSVNPRLRGQTPAYLTITINEFRDGKRGNSPGMSDLLQLCSAEDVKAIVAYLSSVE